MNNIKLIEQYIKKKIKFKLRSKIFSSTESLMNNSIFYSQSINANLLKKINNLKNGILILPKKNNKIKKKIIQIENNNPKLFFFNLIKNLKLKNIKSKDLLIGKNTKIHKNVSIGANAKYFQV